MSSPQGQLLDCMLSEVLLTTVQVKCNSAPGQGSCINCNRLNFNCSFTSSPSTLDDVSRPERKRGSRACSECRSHKSKCSGELPTCSTCQKKGKECVYPELARERPLARRRHSNAASVASHGHSPAVSGSPDHGDFRPSTQMPAPSFAASSENTMASPNQSWRSPSSFNSDGKAQGYSLPLPPVREQLQLVIDFFRHIYPLPIYSFLNEVSLTQRCLEQSLDMTLLLSLCAVAALQLNYTKYHPTFTSSWIKQAENIIWENVDRPSIFRTQALLLIVRYRVDTGDFQKAFMLGSLAARSASALRLQYERTDLSPLAQEVRRRLMWCLVLVEGHFSMGLPECEMCPFEAIYLQLPCKEENFTADNENSHTSTEPLDGVSEAGLLAVHLREAMIRRDIMRLKRQLSLSTQPMPQLEGIVNEFKRTLDSIPIPSYSLSELQRYASSRWIVRYLVVQLSWNQCHCDIYRHFLPGYPEAAPDIITSSCSPAYIAEATRLCLKHAQANLGILSDLMETNSCLKIGDTDMAICGYHASRIVMFLSRSELKPRDSDLTPEQASAAATMVLELLKRYLFQSKLIIKLAKNLEALIEAHNANEPETSRDSSDADEETENRVPRFALAAKQHQRLGVHSILRQTRFVDDSYDAVSGMNVNTARSGSSNLAGPAANLQHPTTNFTQQVTLTQISEPEPFLGTDLAGSFDSTVEVSQFHLNTDPFNWGSADNWSEFYLPNDFSAASDGDFF